MTERKQILIAEDNARDAELTLEALTESRLDDCATIVRDGVEAMEFLRYEGKYRTRKQERTGVVLLDIKMPRMDGIEVLRAIRNDPKLRLCPVVMLTSSRQEQDLIRSYELGINAYVVKPVKFSEFIEAIKYLGIFWAELNELPAGG